MIQTHKYPIILITAPRVGSSATALYLQQQFNVDCFLEPDHTGEIQQFHDFFNKSKKFIAKIHLTQMSKYPDDVRNFLLHDTSVCRIRLRRKNIIKQIASLYIAWIRNIHYNDKPKWNWRITDNLNYRDTVPLDESRMITVTNDVIGYTREICETTISFDYDLWFEDIIASLGSTSIVETPKPDNYTEVLGAIQEIFNNTIRESKIDNSLLLANYGAPTWT
jgi:hypothetical protein